MNNNQWLNKDAIIAQLATLTATTPPDDAMAFYDRWLALKQAIRELDQLVTASMIEVIEAQPTREIIVGTRRYYAGHRKETRCVDTPAAFQTVLELLGPATLAKCLTTQPFKPATVRTLLTQAGCADEFERLFEVVRKQSLKEGAAGKQILTSDDRFV